MVDDKFLMDASMVCGNLVWCVFLLKGYFFLNKIINIKENYTIYHTNVINTMEQLAMLI